MKFLITERIVKVVTVTVIIFCMPFLILSCAVTRSFKGDGVVYDRSLADSMLAYALDHEGLYSLLDTIKPISSLTFFSYAVAKDSSHSAMDYNIATNKPALDSILLYQRICNQLSNEKVKLVLVPFEQPHKGKRNMEIYAVNIQKFKSKIREYASFFGQFGITPESDPAQVITVIEYEKKYDRWRGYGYLFGYPSYAVDFFVSAGRQQDSTGQFVKRDFFQVPVYAGAQGYFTYAMPKDYKPGVMDSLLYNNAVDVLSRYKILRNKYADEKGLKAVKLWRKALKN